jgi:hypothetical protein
MLMSNLLKDFMMNKSYRLKHVDNLSERDIEDLVYYINRKRIRELSKDDILNLYKTITWCLGYDIIETIICQECNADLSLTVKDDNKCINDKCPFKMT